MSELHTARDVIEIQYNGQMGFARLLPTFRARMGSDTLPVSPLICTLATTSASVLRDRKSVV